MTINSVLLIEDSVPDQFLTQCIIEDYSPDIKLHIASDGREALDILNAQNIKPDAILLDVNMPCMNGHEFLNEYSANASQTAIVVMLTSSDQNLDKEKCEKHDLVKKYIMKPIGMHDLKEIEEILTA